MKISGYIACALLAVVVTGATPARAQSKAKTAAWAAPRLADGKPDLNGLWEVRSKADVSLEGKIGGKNIIVDPPDGRIPYKADVKKIAGENTANKCQMPGVPRLAYIPYPFQIVQAANQPVIVILSQYVHVVRNINMGGEHLDGLDLWLGDSRGRWDGDTLVVDVADFNDMTQFDAAGHPHSDALHVVERFTRTSPDTLAYEATVEDRKMLTKPFRISIPIALHTEQNAQLLEYECYAVKEGPTVTVGDKPDPEHARPEPSK